jgi:hypothetical protein
MVSIMTDSIENLYTPGINNDGRRRLPDGNLAGNVPGYDGPPGRGTVHLPGGNFAGTANAGNMVRGTWAMEEDKTQII